MRERRNALVDVTRVAAAVGIILCHTDMTGYGAVGRLAGQFLLVRFSLMFFLAVIGYYVEKSFQDGKNPVFKRVCSLMRVYGVWSLVYLVLSFVMLVLLGKMPLSQYLISRVKGFLFTGSYYHFWFYPAVIYALLLIGGVKKLLGRHALSFLLPLAAALYVTGLLGTGYLPVGQRIPGLRALYAAESFEAIMHLFFLGFPAIVFGMAAAQTRKARSGRAVLLTAAAYVAESVVLCMVLGWDEDPQMLITTPFLTVAFLQWVQNCRWRAAWVNPSLCRTVSSAMYNVHPLLLAGFAMVLPDMVGLRAFLLCTAASAACGWVLYLLRKNRLIALFI